MNMKDDNDMSDADVNGNDKTVQLRQTFFLNQIYFL